MRRLPHILLNAATVLSLLLCVATAVLWVRSYRGGDRFGRTRLRGDVTAVDKRPGWLRFGPGAAVERRGLVSADGTLAVEVSVLRFGPTADVSTELREGLGWHWADADFDAVFGPRTRTARVSHHGFLGFFVYRYEGSLLPIADLTDLRRAAGVPHWFAALSAGLLPAGRLVGVWRRKRRRRRPAGTCPACGYDLRATPERCPECGTAPGR